MDPITILLLAAVVTKVVATHREDMEYARHGQDSPRYRMKLAKAQAARQSGRPAADPPRVGASGYMRDLWDDCWADLGEHRQRSRQARKDKGAAESTREWSRRSLNRREDGTPVDDMLDVAGVRPDDREPGWSGPEPVEGGGPEPEWLTPDPDIEDGPTSVVHTDDHPYCLTPCGPTCTAPRRLSGHGWRCGTCGQDRAGFGTEEDARADAAKHPCRPNPGVATPQELFEAAWKQLDRTSQGNDPSFATCDGCRRRLPSEQVSRSTSAQRLRDGGAEWPGALCKQCRYQRALTIANDRDVAAREFAKNGPLWAPKNTAPAAEPAADSATGGEQLATVIPLFPSTKETVMSNGTDTTGLSTAIAFAEQAASAHESFATAGTEGYTNALVRFEVGDSCVGLALAAQEASQLAAAKWREHLEALQSQLTVREAYQANPDAGSKQFVTGE